MAIGRSRYAPPVSTKGHSVLKSRSYGLSTRPPMPSFTPRSASYSSRAEEHMLTDRVSDVNYLSNALMDEGYDTALRSRGRDQALLKEATNAIVSSESYATPQTSVASRRVARGESVARRASSVPPRPTPRQERSSTSTYQSRYRSRRGNDEDEEEINPLMSWKYRVESMVSPNDLFIMPSSLIRIRQQLNEATAKMGKTREMLDKYLGDEDVDRADAIRMRMSHAIRRDVGLRREKQAREEEVVTEETED